jgi:hypothetical protein
MSTTEFFAYLAQSRATRDLAHELEGIVQQRRSEERTFELAGPRAA